VLAARRDDIPEKVSGMLGEQRLSEASHRTVLDALGDHRPRTIGEVHAAAGGLGFDAVADAVIELAAFDHIAIAQDDATIERCAVPTARLNAKLVALAATSDDIGVLASPVTGGGVAVDRVEQLFCGAIEAGYATPGAWVGDAQARVTSVGGADIGDVAALARGTRRFASHRLPMLRALRVVVD
jgi:hypothetical protein